MTIAKSSYQGKRRPGLKHLPLHYVKTIQNELNGRFSKSYIRKVVQGVYDNDEILTVAIRISNSRENVISNLLGKKNLS